MTVKKLRYLAFALTAVAFCACQKEPSTSSLHKDYLVYTAHDTDADFAAFDTYYTVSYTHLDVYKRQHIDRGGDITFHGPGQLVCYPILDLERLGIGLRAYIDALEESVIRTVAEYGIRAERIAGASGVWVGAGIAQEGDHRTADGGGKCTPAGAPRKICAIGVRSSRYITMHGFALNVTTDLEWFSRINPCGFTDRGATSIERETGAKVPMDDVKRLVVKFLSEILNVRIYK